MSVPTDPTGKPVKLPLGLLGMDQHEVAAASVARALRDGGMAVASVGRVNLPAQIVEAAIRTPRSERRDPDGRFRCRTVTGGTRR